MSIEIKRSINEMKAGDAAVDGLLGGILAGLAMGAFLLMAGLLSNIAPIDTLTRFGLSSTGTPLMGGLMHLAVSGIYGMIYAILSWLLLRRWLSNQSGWLGALAGVVYGLILWLLAQGVVLPVSGSTLTELPAWQFALAHLLFGGLLGWWVWRSITRYLR